jgi:hypothetical protein
MTRITTFEVTDRVGASGLARIAGGLYLAFIVTSVLADLLGHVGLGNAQQIYGAITTSGWTFRLGLVVAFASAFLFLLAAWGLYVLLRPVNQDLALLFLLLNAVGVAIQCASLLQLVSAMIMVDGLPPFQPAQTEAMALLAINVYRTGFVTAQLFFGTWLFPLGYLVYKCGFLPRFLGVLLILDGVAEMIWFLQAFLLPAYPQIKVPGTVVSFVAEVGLALWLLIRGVKVDAAAIDVPPAPPPSVASSDGPSR